LAKTFAGTVLVLLVIILYNVYREHGEDGLRKWFGAKFLNRSYERPAKKRRLRVVAA
jgi:hypothetical protein